jgi:predicted nucleic acid-binding protein
MRWSWPASLEDDTIRGYLPRKRLLRERIAAGGPDAIAIALADKVAHYAAIVALARDAARHPVLATGVAGLLALVATRDGQPADIA